MSVEGRREKRWAELFTCLSIRPVHLELVADLSTDSCLICIRNFVNRPSSRSSSSIQKWQRQQLRWSAKTKIDNTKIQSEMSTICVEWVFNSPNNPESGGAWERLIQSVNRVLSYTLFKEAPRVETLQSLLIGAESIQQPPTYSYLLRRWWTGPTTSLMEHRTARKSLVKIIRKYGACVNSGGNLSS